MMFGLSDVRGMDYPTRWYGRYMDLVPGRFPETSYGVLFESLQSPLLRVLNLKYAIASDQAQLRREGDVRPVLRAGYVTLGRFAHVQPRAFLVYDWVEARSDDEAAQILEAQPEAVYRRVVLSDGQGAPAPIPDGRDGARGRVGVVRYEPERSAWRVRTERPGYLFASDSFYPGWRAYLDGQPTELRRANLAFRAVFVPVGEHVVEFRYEPRSIAVGIWTTVATTVVLAITAALVARKRPRGARPPSP
jgi:hypothetical protein